MQGPEIDNGRLSDVSAEAADGLSQLSQIAGTGNDAEPEIDSAFLTENGGAKVGHGSGGMSLLRAA